MDNNQIEIAKIGSKKNFLLISLKTYKSNQLLDIRRFVTLKNSETIVPTKKGISLRSDKAEFLIDCFDANREKIIDWLKTDSESSELIEFEFNTRVIIQKSKSIGDIDFCKVRFIGSEAEITYNSDHILSKHRDKMDSESSHILDTIIVSYFETKSVFSSNSVYKSQDFFDLLEMNWSMNISKSLKN